jgi:hypothetical protein
MAGKWPHEFLELDPFQEALALACVDLEIEHAMRIAKAGGVFPVLKVGGI